MSTEPDASPKPKGVFRNWISLSGVILALGSVFSFLLLSTFDLFSPVSNPYVGILAYLLAPLFLFMGLFLYLLGGWINYRQRRKARPGAHPPRISIDLARVKDRKVLWTFGGATVLFLLISALGSYQTYHYTESVTFCGQACHEPMEPENVTYQNSPHARVACTECHIGSGATFYVKYKIQGVRQLYHYFLKDYPRPITTPLKNLRPAQDTCEQCHWPAKFTGRLDRTYSHFLSDENNTPFTVRLLLKVGGGATHRGPGSGIHWHVNPKNRVDYITTDKDQQVIPWVRMTDSEGRVTEYVSPGFEDEPENYPMHTIDCMDCHNRPSHQFKTPNELADTALLNGRIDASLPWVKSNVVATLIRPYKNDDEAMAGIEETLTSQYPDYTDLKGLIGEVQDIYQDNFFPEMNADWRAYPDHIGHKDWPGCFRCHDGMHETRDGEQTLGSSGCKSCHLILAQGSGEDLKDFDAEGHPFLHIDATYEDFDCSDCHNGALMEDF